MEEASQLIDALRTIPDLSAASMLSSYANSMEIAHAAKPANKPPAAPRGYFIGRQAIAVKKNIHHLHVRENPDMEKLWKIVL